MTLAGCSTQPVTSRPVADVVVPASCPAPTLPEKPHLALENLADDAPAEQIIAAYAQSLHACTTYARQLTEILRGYAE
ncbi:hypothetical protein WL95_00225 [Burkholderia cepacia]|nr:hypothetical protein WL95_00225 [Burkholderia cepacia]